ncbi:tryptophanyl-tRNA synthetase [Bradyrhizobium sp. USDA 4506]
MTDTQRAGEFKQRYDGWVTAPTLQVADVLLSEAGQLGEFLLRKALLLPQSCKIPADQLAHVHLRKLRLYIL